MKSFIRLDFPRELFSEVSNMFLHKYQEFICIREANDKIQTVFRSRNTYRKFCFSRDFVLFCGFSCRPVCPIRFPILTHSLEILKLLLWICVPASLFLALLLETIRRLCIPRIVFFAQICFQHKGYLPDLKACLKSPFAGHRRLA
jgi:hypothetical protein